MPKTSDGDEVLSLFLRFFIFFLSACSSAADAPLRVRVAQSVILLQKGAGEWKREKRERETERKQKERDEEIALSRENWCHRHDHLCPASTSVDAP